MAVDPWHRYSNETERANLYIYDDFKLENPLFSMAYIKKVSVIEVNNYTSVISWGWDSRVQYVGHFGQLSVVDRQSAELNNLIFHPLKVVSRCRDPQLQVAEKD